MRSVGDAFTFRQFLAQPAPFDEQVVAFVFVYGLVFVFGGAHLLFFERTVSTVLLLSVAGLTVGHLFRTVALAMP
jgi:hypothetical protein